VNIFIAEVRSLVNFEMLKADAILGYFDDELTVAKILSQITGKSIEMTKNQERSGMGSANIIDNISPLIIILVIVLVFYFFFWVISKLCPVKSIRDKL
jgi:hypothetical protein